jgi:hypothetical protein
MSKKEIQMSVDDMVVEAGEGDLLIAVGTAMKAKWIAENGSMLSRDQFSKKSSEDKNATANPVVEVVTANHTFRIEHDGSDGGKTRGNAFANDFGITDKVTTASLPKDEIIARTFDRMVAMLDGVIATAALRDIITTIQDAMDESGKMDKSVLPPLKHPVEVAEIIALLKAQVRKPAKGACHVAAQIVQIPVPVEVDEIAQEVVV